MGEIKLVVHGAPIAKQRHRTMKTGFSYNPQSETEAAVRWEMDFQLPVGHTPYTGPLDLTLVACFARPKSHFGTGRNSDKLKVSSPEHHVKTPDVDNILKFYKDVMNGLVYDDDKQVVKVNCKKRYSERPQVMIIIKEIK